MPYKNPEDRKKWEEKNKERIKKNWQRWVKLNLGKRREQARKSARKRRAEKKDQAEKLSKN